MAEGLGKIKRLYKAAYDQPQSFAGQSVLIGGLS